MKILNNICIQKNQFWKLGQYKVFFVIFVGMTSHRMLLAATRLFDHMLEISRCKYSTLSKFGYTFRDARNWLHMNCQLDIVNLCGLER